MHDSVLLVFTKHPAPGQVKTRLCPPLTAVDAAHLQATCLQFTWKSLAATIEAQRVLVVSPDHEQDACRRIAGHDGETWPQGGGDLGQRLQRAVDHAFRIGAKSVVCIGADSPTLPADTLPQALGLLSKGCAVAGPCEDGGFYLLGVTESAPGLLDDIHWGESTVMSELRSNAARLGIRVEELSTWYDIDRIEDVIRAAKDLEQQAPDPCRDALLAVLRETAQAAALQSASQDDTAPRG